MKNYVVGFCFDHSCDQVVLIKKTKPNWQKDRLNGVGGKLEEGETPVEAMAREYYEETGVHIPTANWIHFAELAIVPPDAEKESPGNFIDCFCVINESEVTTTTTEEVDWYDTFKLYLKRTVPNVQWMVPMAADRLKNPHTFEKARIVYRND
jgi:8-oxo-dGTP diphosphatase